MSRNDRLDWNNQNHSNQARMKDAFIEFEYELVLAESEKAWNISFTPNASCWIAKKLCQFKGEDRVLIAGWLVIQIGLRDRVPECIVDVRTGKAGGKGIKKRVIADKKQMKADRAAWKANKKIDGRNIRKIDI